MKLFTPPPFLSASNIYEVNLRQYTPEGTIHAFIKHLPRLKDMGVQILWFMPVHPIGEVNRKGSLGSYYSIKNFKEINPEYGSKDDFLFMVKEIHLLGMKIILDWVANHAAWDNNWTFTNPEFFIRDESGRFKAPYDWDDVIQIDHTSESEQQEMINTMSYWVTQFDIDGFRADLAHLTPLAFWINARRQISEIKKDLIWLAETEEPSYHDAFDISYTWKWMHVTEEVIKKKQEFPALRDSLNEYRNVFGDEFKMFFTSNHDENSWNGTEYEKYGKFAKALAVFSFTYFQSVPLIYSGQELPLQRRLKFFDKDPVEWSAEPELHGFYKRLNELRKKNPSVVCSEKTTFAFIESVPGLLCFQRIFQESAVIVAINFSENRISTRLQSNFKEGKYNNLFTLETVLVNDFVEADLIPGGFLVLSIP